MTFLYGQLLEINKKLPCNIYLPFLAGSTRNYFSKPILIPKIGVPNLSRHKTNVLNPISEKKPNRKTEMTEIVTKEKKR